MWSSKMIRASSLSMLSSSASSAKVGLSSSKCCASCQVVLCRMLVIESKMSLSTCMLRLRSTLDSSFSFFAKKKRTSS
uniref:Putative secreted protein n=1 Tax=Ixodes ricinus TaxID=34613 RepID=A0A6B0U3G4_IXORI